jgi:hypothetical protein
VNLPNQDIENRLQGTNHDEFNVHLCHLMKKKDVPLCHSHIHRKNCPMAITALKISDKPKGEEKMFSDSPTVRK